jgi:hypothetical protein
LRRGMLIAVLSGRDIEVEGSMYLVSTMFLTKKEQDTYVIAENGIRLLHRRSLLVSIHPRWRVLPVRRRRLL